MTILHRAVVLPTRIVDEENAVLTLALATIVVLTVASLALMLWPEAPSPESPDVDEQDTRDRAGVEEGHERDNPLG